LSVMEEQGIPRGEIKFVDLWRTAKAKALF